VLVHNTCVDLDLKGRIGQNKSIPKQAYRVLKDYAKNGELPKNFHPAHKFVDKLKQLPKRGKYMEVMSERKRSVCASEIGTVVAQIERHFYTVFFFNNLCFHFYP
jgi:hypothetical protein